MNPVLLPASSASVTPGRNRGRIPVALGLVIALCWAWIVPMARDMYGSMTGAAAWMMTGTWDLAHLLLLFAMWVVMMAGMMLPSVAPVLLRHAVRGPGGPAVAGGYLLVWTGFALLATVLQRLLAGAHLLTPMMEFGDSRLGGTLFILAGLYQFTPWKRTCLNSCRCPEEPDTGSAIPGGFSRGFSGGLHCLGCCWALMMLLFVVGVMNVWANLGLTMVVLLEKVLPWGHRGGRAVGTALVGWGAWSLLAG